MTIHIEGLVYNFFFYPNDLPQGIEIICESVISVFNITLTNLHKCTACLIDFFLLIFRMMYWPRGRVWGGSSALNAMVYIRGHAYDYDRWEKEGGAEGWSYADCLPYFKKSQTHQLGG